MNDYNNVKNVIAHEKFHKEAKSVIKTFGDHADVYAKQIDDATFNDTTDDFKVGQLAAVATYLANGLKGNANVASDGEAQIMNILNKVNSALKKSKGEYQIRFEPGKPTGARLS